MRRKLIVKFYKITIGYLAITAFMLAALGSSHTVSSAESQKSMTIAHELGSLLASEQFCGLRFKQDAIQEFIEKNVAADDMKFPPMLQTMIVGAKFQLGETSESARTAHCAQVRRISGSYGFIAKQ
jgi:hypothetical protein